MKLPKNFPFPSSPDDGQVAAQDDIVCVYVADANTWKCTRTTNKNSMPGVVDKPTTEKN
jgi:hypothetical protein